MYLELSLIPFAILLVLFLCFFVTAEGSKWQKHPQLGVFARFIQVSPLRGFLVFFVLTILMVPSVLLIILGYWTDAVITGTVPNTTTPIVNVLLLLLLILSGMIPVLWSHFRTWRQAVRSAAEVRVRTIE